MRESHDADNSHHAHAGSSGTSSVGPQIIDNGVPAPLFHDEASTDIESEAELVDQDILEVVQGVNVDLVPSNTVSIISSSYGPMQQGNGENPGG